MKNEIVNYYAIPGLRLEKEVMFEENETAKYLKREAKLFFKTHINSFGTYPKTKYCLNVHNQYRDPLYSFVTTRYTEKEAIGIMHKFADTANPKGYTYFIYKIEKGVRKLLFKSVPRGIKLTDEKKEFIIENYKTINPFVMSRKLNISESTILKFRQKEGLLLT